jgi:hypothetical protein
MYFDCPDAIDLDEQADPAEFRSELSRPSCSATAVSSLSGRLLPDLWTPDPAMTNMIPPSDSSISAPEPPPNKITESNTLQPAQVPKEAMGALYVPSHQFLAALISDGQRIVT